MSAHRRISSFSLRALGVAALSVVTVLAACSDAAAPTASAPRLAATTPASADRGGIPASHGANTSTVQGLQRDVPLQRPISASRRIGHGGGVIIVPGTDFALVVPRGAFDADSLTITVTALAGSTVAYEFEPHGTVFNVPLTFVQGLGRTRIHGMSSQLEGDYFPDASQIDPATGTAVVTERIPASVDRMWPGDVLTFPIKHFSGYLISTGRGGQ